APPPDPVYEMDPAKHVVPAGPVVGRLAGERVSGEARIEAGELVFQKPAGAPGDDWRVSGKLPPEALKGEPYRAVVAADKTPGASVLVDFPKEVQLAEYDPAPGADPGARKRTGWKPAKVMGWEGGCALTLELGPRVAGKVPGKV